jgi:ATP-dependent DNA ligase
LHGNRVSGRHVLFPTDGKNWMIHRMDPPVDPDAEPMPERIDPVWPEPRKRLPRRADAYGFEFAWGGRRLIVFSDRGTARAQDGDGKAAKALSGLGEALAAHRVVLDGEVATIEGRETYMVFDLLYLDGRSLLDEAYRRRRELLEGLRLAGPRWQTAPCFDDGKAVLAAAREQGLPGVVAKRLDAPYRPGKADWRLIPVRDS